MSYIILLRLTEFTNWFLCCLLASHLCVVTVGSNGLSTQRFYIFYFLFSSLCFLCHYVCCALPM